MEVRCAIPGREDFAIIRARLLADPRAMTAADAYVDAGIAVEDTATATVVGHIASLGLWTSRETDDGILPGDGIAAFRVAATCTRRVADLALTCLLQAKLLRRIRGGLYLVGFSECYAPIIRRRARNRENAVQARKRKSVADVDDTSATGHGDVSDHQTRPDQTRPERTGTEQIGLAASASLAVVGGNGKSGLHPGQKLTPTAWIAVSAILDRLCEGLEGRDVQQNALHWRQLLRTCKLDDEVGADLLDRYKARFAASIGKAKRRGAAR